MNWTEFFNMGGYAFYVWTSWALTLLVLCWHIIQPKVKNARIKTDIKRQIDREAKLAAQNQNAN